MKNKKEELEAELTRLNALRKQVRDKLKALPIEQDKFAELKEAHSKGALIQWRRSSDRTLDSKIWKDCNDNDPPTWRDFNEYRIKPEEKPKVGDWIKYETGGGTKIAKLTEKNIYSFDKPKFKHTIIKDCYMIDKLNDL